MSDFLQSADRVLNYEIIAVAGTPITLASILACLLVVLVAWLLARTAGRAIAGAIMRRGRARGAALATATIVRYVILALGVFVALDTLGFNLTALIAGASVLLVGIGFGLQNIAQNFISGLIVLFERPVKPGDFIQVGQTFGLVQSIGLRATAVSTRDEVTILIPNSELISQQVTNLSVPSENLRVWVKVGVAYGSDTALVRETLLRVAREHADVLDEPPPIVRFSDFGNSSLDFALLFWIADPPEDIRIASDLRFAIDQAFRAADITIPFPQRDLHIKSGLRSTPISH